MVLANPTHKAFSTNSQSLTSELEVKFMNCLLRALDTSA